MFSFHEYICLYFLTKKKKIMKLLMKIMLILGVSVLLTADSLIAQDMIYTKDKKEAIEAKVIEVSSAEIKYRIWEEAKDGVVYSVEKSAIDKIEFENGRTEHFGQEMIDQDRNFTGQKKRVLKISFIEPMIASTSITYEQNIKPGRSLEFKATIVGAGLNNDLREARGFIGGASYKFYRKPSFVTSDLKRRHLLQGAYFKPEVFIGHTSYDNWIRYIYSDPMEEARESSATGGFLLNLGRQWVAGDVFVVDLHAGIGFGAGESCFGYIVAENNIAFSFGLDIGFAF